jgi:hypothetical protein
MPITNYYLRLLPMSLFPSSEKVGSMTFQLVAVVVKPLHVVATCRRETNTMWASTIIHYNRKKLLPPQSDHNITQLVFPSPVGSETWKNEQLAV